MSTQFKFIPTVTFFDLWEKKKLAHSTESGDDWHVVQKFIVEGITDYTNTNEKNCTQLAPFADGLIALRSWYEPRKKYFNIQNITLVDKLPSNVTRKSYEFREMYNQYLNYYDYANDMKIIGNDVKIVKIPFNVLTEIFQTNTISIYTKRDEWYKELEGAINSYNNKCFVRGERVSAKNDSGKKIITSAEECLLYLGTSNDIQKSLCNMKSMSEISSIVDTYIAVMPWNENINLSNEFRIFVLDGKIRAISQQKWYVYAGLTRERITNITSDLFAGTMKIVDKLPYLDSSLDVWIDNNKEVHLIEVNPGGQWCCSASMLFNWTDDSIWDDDGQIYVRYVEQSIENFELD